MTAATAHQPGTCHPLCTSCQRLLGQRQQPTPPAGGPSAARTAPGADQMTDTPMQGAHVHTMGTLLATITLPLPAHEYAGQLLDIAAAHPTAVLYHPDPETTEVRLPEDRTGCPICDPRPTGSKHTNLTDRLIEANHRHHTDIAPTCSTWERYSTPAIDPDTRKRTTMDGIGCREHGVFLSWPSDRPMP